MQSVFLGHMDEPFTFIYKGKNAVQVTKHSAYVDVKVENLCQSGVTAHNFTPNSPIAGWLTIEKVSTCEDVTLSDVQAEIRTFLQSVGLANMNMQSGELTTPWYEALGAYMPPVPALIPLTHEIIAQGVAAATEQNPFEIYLLMPAVRRTQDAQTETVTVLASLTSYGDNTVFGNIYICGDEQMTTGIYNGPVEQHIIEAQDLGCSVVEFEELNPAADVLRMITAGGVITYDETTFIGAMDCVGKQLTHSFVPVQPIELPYTSPSDLYSVLDNLSAGESVTILANGSLGIITKTAEGKLSIKTSACALAENNTAYLRQYVIGMTASGVSIDNVYLCDAEANDYTSSDVYALLSMQYPTDLVDGGFETNADEWVNVEYFVEV